MLYLPRELSKRGCGYSEEGEHEAGGRKPTHDQTLSHFKAKAKRQEDIAKNNHATAVATIMMLQLLLFQQTPHNNTSRSLFLFAILHIYTNRRGFDTFDTSCRPGAPASTTNNNGQHLSDAFQTLMLRITNLKHPPAPCEPIYKNSCSSGNSTGIHRRATFVV